MVKIKTVERQIAKLEGFKVAFTRNGKDVHGNKEGVPPYTFERRAKDDMTIAQWVSSRFNTKYSGYDVDVLDGEGECCQGNTKLGSVRDTY